MFLGRKLSFGCDQCKTIAEAHLAICVLVYSARNCLLSFPYNLKRISSTIKRSRNRYHGDLLQPITGLPPTAGSNQVKCSHEPGYIFTASSYLSLWIKHLLFYLHGIFKFRTGTFCITNLAILFSTKKIFLYTSLQCIEQHRNLRGTRNLKSRNIPVGDLSFSWISLPLSHEGMSPGFGKAATILQRQGFLVGTCWRNHEQDADCWPNCRYCYLCSSSSTLYLQYRICVSFGEQNTNWRTFCSMILARI